MFIYSAFDISLENPKYSQECIVSILSLRKHTETDINVYTNNPDYFNLMINHLNIKNIKTTYIDNSTTAKELKIRSMIMTQCPFIYLDTHTIVLDKLDFLLQELVKSDYKIAGSAAPWRENFGELSIKLAKAEMDKIYEINTGVIFSSGNNVDLFDTWLQEYRSALKINENPLLVKDQPAFKKASVINNTNILKLPNNYNFRANFGGVVSGKVYVYHSHYGTNLIDIVRSNYDNEIVNDFLENISLINSSHKTYNYSPLLQKERVIKNTLDRSYSLEKI